MSVSSPGKDPILSIVLIVRHPEETPDAVLAALTSETEDLADGLATETILVEGRPGASHPSGSLPVRFTRLWRPGLNMPRLKAEGAAAARGQAIAFLEPKAVPAQGWLRAALAAIAANPGALLGGAVMAGSGGAVDRAAYAFEYSAFSLTALAQGIGKDLPGNNMVLPLAALRDLCGDILDAEGLNKPFCQARLTSSGLAVVMAPKMAVRITTHYRLRALLASRFRYARCYGGTRATLANQRQLWLYRLAAPLVPILLLWRHLGAALRATGSDRPGTGALAALSALCLAWSAGEATGSWAGPGRACDALY